MPESQLQNTSASGWKPLAYPLFRDRLIASVISNIGGWMEDTAGTWLMTALTASPLLIALMQTAASLPVLLLGLPAGAMADILDRRRLLLIWSVWMLIAAAFLSVMTILGVIGVWTLLVLTFLLSVGTAMNAPTWQAIVPELVPREEVPNAVALNSAGFNLARAVGPAAGGLIVAAFATVLTGAGIVFFINSICFVAVLIVLYRWKRTQYFKSALPAERMFGSMRAAIRYVRFAPAMRTILVRTFIQTFCVSGMWALLAVISRDDLHSGAMGYGILNGCLGAGAVLGAISFPRVRRRYSADRIVKVSAVLFTLTLLVMAWLPQWIPLIIGLVLGGVAWTSTASSLNIAVQLSVPAWVQARMLGLFQMIFQGGLAIGSALWGAVADRVSPTAALTASAACFVVGWPLMNRFRLVSGGEQDLSPGRLRASIGGLPQRSLEPDLEEGPVLVTVTFRIDPVRASEFVAAAHDLGRIRRRDGAIQWGLYRDPFDPARFMESYVLESWLERERQLERFTVADHEIRNRVFSFHVDATPPTVSRMILAEPAADS